MATLVVNLSGNARGFEDAFCEELVRRLQGLGHEVKYRCIRGEQLARERIMDGGGYEVVVVAAHAGRRKCDSTLRVSMGLENGVPKELCHMVLALMSPDVLMQCLTGNECRYVLVYCACRALAPEALAAAAVHDPQCRGIVASTETIREDQLDIVCQVAEAVRNALAEGSSLHDAVDAAVKRAGSAQPFVYMDAPEFC